MRILFGVFAQGHGHFSKAAVLVRVLEEQGHDVRVVSSGNTRVPPGYPFRWHRHFPCLSYCVKYSRVDVARTLVRWLGQLPQIARHLNSVRELVREFQPDLIVSDFEPLTASPLLRAPCEVVALSRQAALCDPRVPLPDRGVDRKLARSVIRLFTCGADRSYGYHYQPASPRCLPPIVRPELWSLEPELGAHLLVYNGFPNRRDSSPGALVRWAERRRVPIRAYGFPGVGRGSCGLVRFCPPGPGLLDDLRTCRAAISTAGMTIPLEAFLLGKPAAVVPIERQWEQHVNAVHLNDAGLATAMTRWDYDRVCGLTAPTDPHPLDQWLKTRAEWVIAHVLNDTAGASRAAT